MTSKSKPTFPKAAAAVLEPAGFVRQGRSSSWVRQIGDYQDLVDLQVSSGLDEITLNVFMLDERIHALMLDVSPGRNFATHPVNVRLPHRLFGRDRWWKRSDPDGPAQLADMIRDHALPFLDGLHSAEGLLAYLEPTIVKWRNPTGRKYAAVLLHEMGRQDECCELLAVAPRLVRGPDLDRLRERLGCPVPES